MVKKAKRILSGILGVLAVVSIVLMMCLLPYAFWPLRSILFYGMLFMLFIRLMCPRQIQLSGCCCRANSCGSGCCEPEEIQEEATTGEK